MAHEFIWKWALDCRLQLDLNNALFNIKRMKFILMIILGFFSFSLPAHAGYEKDYIGEIEIHKAAYEDTFVKIARSNNLGYVEMRAANPNIDPWIPGEGTEILLPKRHLLPTSPRKGIVINLPEMRLYYFQEDRRPQSFPIGIGREGFDTPLGQSSVTRKKAGPSWRPTQRMRQEDPDLPAVVPPGPNNPLGAFALYLGWPQYLIHGTNKPYGIGRRVSSGCIRLYSEDISFLFTHAKPGIPVYVIDQPIKAGWIEDDFYIEAHPIREELDFMESSGRVERTKMGPDDVALILERAGEKIAENLDWPAIRKAVEERRGIPVKIASKTGHAQLKKSRKDSNPNYREIGSRRENGNTEDTQSSPDRSKDEEAQKIKMNLNL